jgi:hypothetical protein
MKFGPLAFDERVVQPATRMDADLSYLVGDAAKDLLVGRRPFESPSGPTM